LYLDHSAHMIRVREHSAPNWPRTSSNPARR
jgi:hypothetical protein